MSAHASQAFSTSTILISKIYPGFRPRYHITFISTCNRALNRRQFSGFHRFHRSQQWRKYTAGMSKLRLKCHVTPAISNSTQLVCATVSVDGWCAASLWTGQVCGVYQLWDLVLVYSVPYIRKFHWLQALCILHPTGTPCDSSSAIIPAWSYRLQCIGDLDAVCSLQPFVI